MMTGSLRLEHRAHAVEDALAERLELRAAMVDRRHVHGPQHAVGDIRRSRDLQEVPAGHRVHRLSLPPWSPHSGCRLRRWLPDLWIGFLVCN